MRKNQRFAFLAIGGLGLLAAIAPGLAAGIQTPSEANAPAAGQGEVVVQGFEVTDINWVIDGETERVIEITFNIVRKVSGAAAVVAGTGTADDNATVRVRLESVDDGNAAWEDCEVVAAQGDATCDLEAGSGGPEISGAQMLASSLDRVNIIAFDSN